MSDLLWTMPVARWAFISEEGLKEAVTVTQAVRRRLGRLSRLALLAAAECVDPSDTSAVSIQARHHELMRTTDILHDICDRQPLSLPIFSLSVLNAMTGVSGITCCDVSPSALIAAGRQTLGYALLEAYARSKADPSRAVLLVYASEVTETAHAGSGDDPAGEALAVLVDPQRATGYLTCSATRTGARQEKVAPETGVTQGAAVRRCLASCGEAIWQSEDSVWKWQWREHRA